MRDPTSNVLDLVRAETRRQDDLRQAESEHLLRAVQVLNDVAGLREKYDERLREAESARIDAIRLVDVQAVQRAAEVSAASALTLATQVATSAETLRTQVQAAATASTVALAAALEPIQKDVADLRRVQYESQGIRVAASETRDDRRQGTSLGVQFALVAIGGFSFLAAVAAIIITLTR